MSRIADRLYAETSSSYMDRGQSHTFQGIDHLAHMAQICAIPQEAAGAPYAATRYRGIAYSEKSAQIAAQELPGP